LFLRLGRYLPVLVWRDLVRIAKPLWKPVKLKKYIILSAMTNTESLSYLNKYEVMHTMASNRSAMFKSDYFLCPSQVACDGERLQKGQEVCKSCRDTLKRRQQAAAQPLKGEHCVTYLKTRYKRKKQQSSKDSSDETNPLPKSKMSPSTVD
jgi:hypothetical protein